MALVDGQPVRQARFDAVFARYVESLKLAKQPVPPKGSAQYTAAQQGEVKNLVQQMEIEQQAKKLHVIVTPKEIDAAIKKFVDGSFGGSLKKYHAAEKKQHITEAQVRDNVRFNLLLSNIAKKLTDPIKVSDQEALAYYNKNIAQYTKAASRDLEHILVKTKKLAESIYKQLQNGGSFAKLAKKYSIDKGSAVKGGKLGVQFENQLVAPFAKVGFALKTGELSKPTKSQFGWHVIKALGPVIPATKSPFSKEKPAITQQLLQAKKSDTMAAWQNTVQTYYSTKVKYASAYAPPQTTAPAATSLLPTTTNPSG